MAQVTDEIASEYGRIFGRSKQDPGTAGDEGEENWATLFREWLPPTYSVVTKGRLIGYDGSMSPQVDVLIIKPSYPKKLLEKKIWLADGVVAAFECKNTIKSSHIISSGQRCAQFKKIMRPRGGTPQSELRSPLIYGILAHSHSWKSEKSEPISNIEEALKKARVGISHPRELIDTICIADLATWNSIYVSRYELSWLGSEFNNIKVAMGNSWAITTSMTCASSETFEQKSTFRPIGSLISYLTQRIAWNDPIVRDLADYYRSVNISGNFDGEQLFWKPTAYSEDVRRQVDLGRITQGDPWCEWSLASV